MEKLKQNSIVEVQWFDTSTTSEWTSSDAMDKATPIPVKTVGYYHGCKRIGNKVRWIVIKHNLCSDGNADYTVIPYGCVIKIERLEV